MSSWKGKTRGGLTGHRFFIILLKYAGLKFSYFFLRFVVLYFVFFAPKARNPVFWYFRNIHGFNRLKSTRYLFKNFYVLGRVLLDKVALLAGYNTHFTFDFEGEEYLHRLAGEDGGFLIGAHIGNWEIAGQLLERIQTKVNIVMVEAEHERIKDLLDEVMIKKSMDIITIKDDFSHLIEIKNALDNHEIVAIHGDRFLEGAKTITGKLLGHEALFPYGPFYMALKYNRPVSFVSAVKETDTHYHFYATQPRKYGSSGNAAEKDRQLKKIVNDYTDEMARILKMVPEQWFNYYYFWSLRNNEMEK